MGNTQVTVSAEEFVNEFKSQMRSFLLSNGNSIYSKNVDTCFREACRNFKSDMSDLPKALKDFYRKEVVASQFKERSYHLLASMLDRIVRIEKSGKPW